MKIELLQSPTYVKTRYGYATIDTFIYDSVFFHKRLPMYEYPLVSDKNNNEPAVLKTTVYEKQAFDSSILKNGLILPNLQNWAIGKYRLTVYVFDAQLGDSIQKSVVFDVVDARQNLAPSVTDLTVFLDKSVYLKDQKIPIHILSPFDKSSILIEFFDGLKPLKSEWINMSSSFFTYDLSPQKIENNLFFRITMVKDNRIFCKTGKIPLINYKNLNLSFTTFRDHLAPGQNETWTIHITDEKGKPVSAELAATLYDAALDNLKDNPPYNWYDWAYFTAQSSYINEVYENNFESVSTDHVYHPPFKYAPLFINYKPSPRTWLWFSMYYGVDEQDESLLNYLSNKRTENTNNIRRSIFYKDGKRYMSILSLMQIDSNVLPVLIIGYSTVTKKNLTGVVSKIDSEEIMARFSRAELIPRIIENDILIRGLRSNVSPMGYNVKNYSMIAADVDKSSLSEVVVTGYGTLKKMPPSVKTPDLAQVKIRKNLSETVFFMPQLQTDAKGNVQLHFTMNEALTRWKFMSFAHTAQLQSGILYAMAVTQKDLMVFPNMPRFLRQGDEIELVTKVSNVKTGDILRGVASLNLFNAATEQSVDSLFLISKPILEWTATANNSAVLTWKIKVPEGTDVPALTWRVAAQSGNFSDGEQNTIPVLPKQILLTQTISLSIEGGKTDSIHFSLMDNPSKTMRNHRFDLNIVANPAWHAVTGLAYSMAYPHECSEQLFSRFYSNTLAASVFERMPQLKVFLSQNGRESVVSGGTSSVLPTELQRTLMEEAPELMAENGVFDKQKWTQLFDLKRMADEKQKDFDKLATRLTPSGGLAWYPEGEPSWFISQHVLAGLGHLQTLGVALPMDAATQKWVKNLVLYTDSEVAKYHQKKPTNPQKTLDYTWNNGQNLLIQHAYMRSFYPQIPFSDSIKQYINSTLKYIETDWQTMDLYQKAMGALALHRFGKKEIAQKVIVFLKKTAKIDVSGMHWAQRQGIYWYEMHVETQALLIEAFNEISHDSASVFLMKKHLLSQVQDKGRWASTKATTEAIYALLLVGDETPNKTNLIKIENSNKIFLKQIIESIQADKGFIQATVKGVDMDKNLAKTHFLNQNRGDITGSVSWLFYENIDKVKFFNNTDSVVQLKKQMYKISSSGGDAQNHTVIDQSPPLSIGDKIRIKLTIKTLKPLEYVHLKDMRPATCEPVDVISKREGQNLSYYKTTRDVSTNFFFDNIPIGEFTVEYDVTVQQKGDFASGLASLQCMYVPSVTTYTEGGRLVIR